MANYPQHRRGFDIDTTAAAAQKITIDSKWKGHSVTYGATLDTIKLAGDDDKIIGSIDYFDSGQVVIVDEGEDVAFKNAGTAAIPLGSRIVGSRRRVGGSQVYGYVKAFTPATAAEADTTDFANKAERDAAINAAINAAVDATVSAALKARGSVVDGGAATNTTNEDVPADVRVAFNRCA